MMVFGIGLIIAGFGLLGYVVFKQNTIKENKNTTKRVERANAQARTIIQKALDKAENILFQTEYIKQDFVKESQAELEQVAKTTIASLESESSAFEEEYRKLFEDIRKMYVQKAGEILETVEKIADEELTDFRNVLRSETTAAQGYINQKVIEEFEQSKKEIAEYKQEKIAFIDANIKKVVMQVTTDLLGVVIPIHEHEKLVLEALEKAKKEGVFLE